MNLLLAAASSVPATVNHTMLICAIFSFGIAIAEGFVWNHLSRPYGAPFLALGALFLTLAFFIK